MSSRAMMVGAAVMAAVMVSAACGSGQPEGAPAQAGMDVILTTTPDPVQTGDNTFEVMVREDGKPVTDATVSTEFYMASM
nr:FixH family protein [Acidobacteriota bacterium]